MDALAMQETQETQANCRQGRAGQLGGKAYLGRGLMRDAQQVSVGRESGQQAV
jgi:hypothetical protein